MTNKILSVLVLLVAAGVIVLFFSGEQDHEGSIDKAIVATRDAATAAVDAVKDSATNVVDPASEVVEDDVESVREARDQ